MSFYEQLSQVYDDVFPINETTFRFLREGLGNEAKILDVACGTGGYSVLLSGAGHRVYGIDQDAGMIEKATAKGAAVTFLQEDMVRSKELFAGERFDLIYCIGNSFVHLKDRQEMKQLIQDWYDMLSEHGSLIIQTVNYQRILKNNITSLPMIHREAKGITFDRQYDINRDEGTVGFKTELTVTNEAGTVSYKNCVPLIPVEIEELNGWITAAGFRKTEVFGDYLKGEYREDSPAAIVKAYKKGLCQKPKLF
ncbi:Methyltransferase domain-containing protein [Evansella caseinilytica]|uniref:Methyltransferase domain-containing protein n=1 Tax=Evansella caseinilytica TaxID=1503961 RepID=A0A1H3Q8Q7_9BACI|nr:class I SAM-dependent methyltransferase [Evansella caseinilytica]SDZ09630.1 Methyltransferase domain-containing protein [Evansella caseinilytica]